MRQCLFLLFTVTLGILQLSALDVLGFFNIKPDLLLAAGITAIFLFEFKYAIVLAIFCGVFKDIFSAPPFGLNTVLFALWAFFVYYLCRQISTELTLVRIAIVFLIAFLHNLVSALIVIHSGGFIPYGIFSRILLIAPIYTALVSFLIFKAAKIITDR